MAQIVGGVVASHNTLMNTDFDRVVDRDAATAFRDALGEAREFLTALRPDVLICLGSNHFRGFFMDLMPAFSIGVGEVIGMGEAGTPAGQLPTDPSYARHLLEGLSVRDFDVAFSIRMSIDHGITHAIQHLAPAASIPIVPIVINVFAPPLPSVLRCAQIGAALREATAAYAPDTRVAVIGSGGLSHHLPWPDWRAPETENDRFLVEAWLNGREGWQKYEAPRRAIIREATAVISPAFDRRFLEELQVASADELGRTFEAVEDQAGNGGAELRNWIAAKAAAGDGRVDVLGYWPIEEWLTGMGVALLQGGEATEEATDVA